MKVFLINLFSAYYSVSCLAVCYCYTKMAKSARGKVRNASRNSIEENITFHLCLLLSHNNSFFPQNVQIAYCSRLFGAFHLLLWLPFASGRSITDFETLHQMNKMAFHHGKHQLPEETNHPPRAQAHNIMLMHATTFSAPGSCECTNERTNEWKVIYLWEVQIINKQWNNIALCLFNSLIFIVYTTQPLSAFKYSSIIRKTIQSPRT